MDVMVAPERQRQGLGEVLFRTWDRNVGASLGLGLSESSYRLFQKLRWPDVGPGALPREAADAPRAAAAELADADQPPRVGGDAARSSASSRARGRCAREIELIRRFDEQFTALWERARAEVRLRGPARRRVPQLEVHRSRRTSATRSPR